jgi:hypothetical protein
MYYIISQIYEDFMIFLNLSKRLTKMSADCGIKTFGACAEDNSSIT